MAEWMLTIHPNFEFLDEGAWARRILQRKELTGEEKIQMLAGQMPRRALSRVQSGDDK